MALVISGRFSEQSSNDAVIDVLCAASSGDYVRYVSLSIGANCPQPTIINVIKAAWWGATSFMALGQQPIEPYS